MQGLEQSSYEELSADSHGWTLWNAECKWVPLHGRSPTLPLPRVRQASVPIVEALVPAVPSEVIQFEQEGIDLVPVERTNLRCGGRCEDRGCCGVGSAVRVRRCVQGDCEIQGVV